MKKINLTGINTSMNNYIQMKTLRCGIRVIMEKIDYVQSASFGVWVKTGAVNEKAQNAGISHFIEHMLFKGTEKRNSRQIAEDIDKIGGQINAFTGKEATCFYVKTLSNSLEKGAEVVLDMVNNAVFNSSEMDKERQVICEEIKMVEDQPDEIAHDTILELVFAGNPLGNSIIGTPKSLGLIDRKVIIDYKTREYTKDSIVVSVAGNFNEDQVLEFLDNKFEKLTDSKDKLILKKSEYKKSFKVLKRDIQQSHLCLATKGVSLTDPRYFALSILNNVMGGSMSSRLFQNIREEQGLAYSVYSVQSSFSYDGYFNIYAGVAHDKIEKTIKAIEKELEILSKNGISKEEMEMSKEQLKSTYIFGQENVASRMFVNGKNALLLDKIFSSEEIIKKYDEVKMDDIENAKELICDVNSYSGVLVSDREINLEKLV